ncbi:MAG: hypothetical protein K2X01_03040 [Cyanobacteria bacterium]|nr:hypothetical protein [Cyanobacteriota bacterium]
MGISHYKDKVLKTSYFGHSISDYAIIGGLVVSFGAGAFYVFGLSFQDTVSASMSPLSSSTETAGHNGRLYVPPDNTNGVLGGNDTMAGGGSGGSAFYGPNPPGYNTSASDPSGSNGTGGYNGGGVYGGGTAGGGSGQGLAGTVMRGGNTSGDSWFNPTDGGDEITSGNGDLLNAPGRVLGGGTTPGDFGSLDPANLENPSGNPGGRDGLPAVPSPAPSLPPPSDPANNQ